MSFTLGSLRTLLWWLLIQRIQLHARDDLTLHLVTIALYSGLDHTFSFVTYSYENKAVPQHFNSLCSAESTKPFQDACSNLNYRLRSFVFVCTAPFPIYREKGLSNLNGFLQIFAILLSFLPGPFQSTIYIQASICLPHYKIVILKIIEDS